MTFSDTVNMLYNLEVSVDNIFLLHFLFFFLSISMLFPLKLIHLPEMVQAFPSVANARTGSNELLLIMFNICLTIIKGQK